MANQYLTENSIDSITDSLFYLFSGIDGRSKPKVDTLSFVPKEHYIEDISDIFDFHKSLGKGASCSVSLVHHKETNEQFALKQMATSDPLNAALFATERKIIN